MDKNISIHLPPNVFSSGALFDARRFVQLVEALLSQAHSDERSAELEEIGDPRLNEADYATCVGIIDSAFEDGFRPILRYASVVYIYTVFETHVYRHADEIQHLLPSNSENLKKLKKGQSLVNAAKNYFSNSADIQFFDENEWEKLREIAAVRNCIVHDSGIPKNSNSGDLIYHLEDRLWHGQKVGLEIERNASIDAGKPMILQQRFLEYCLSIFEEFFSNLGFAIETKFHKK